MIDIINHRCSAMPRDQTIQLEKGTWYLQGEQCVFVYNKATDESDAEDFEFMVEITHCPWCGKEL